MRAQIDIVDNLLAFNGLYKYLLNYYIYRIKITQSYQLAIKYLIVIIHNMLGIIVIIKLLDILYSNNRSGLSNIARSSKMIYFNNKEFD